MGILERAIKPLKVEEIDIETIYVPHRDRKAMGNISELASVIEEEGLINPITVKVYQGSEEMGKAVNFKHSLLAGERRLKAVEELGWTKVMANIYPKDLTDLEIRVIELSENINRKNFEWVEEVTLKARIHETLEELAGEKKGGGDKWEGHSQADTAKILGETPATLSIDLKLKRAIEVIPELGEAKDKKEAHKMLASLEDELKARKVAKRIEEGKEKLGESGVKKKLVGSYILGDFLKKSEDIQTGTVDLVELDPPFAIGLKRKKKDVNIVKADSYEEVDPKAYPEFMKQVLKVSWRIMSPDSWIVVWFGPEPWFQSIYEWMTEVGFKTRRIPGIWSKGPPGQTLSPSTALGNTYEMFFYGRKGSPELNKSGRSNEFRYKPVISQEKSHITEKPIDMYMDLVSTFCPPGSLACIPFLGSGNCILGAHDVGVDAFGYDKSESHRSRYVIKVKVGEPGNFHETCRNKVEGYYD